jgi:hypothetical protein
MVFMGGAVASESVAIASSDICGHLLISTAPCATFIAKAIQVGLPHSLQFVFGVNLKISKPFNAMVIYPPFSIKPIL